MKVLSMILVVVFMLTAPVDAGELQKDYFTATVPGAWVTVEMTSDNGGRIVYTYSRLEDNQGRAVVELEMAVEAGPGEGTSNRQLFVIEEGFDITKDALSYMKALEVMISLTGDYISVLPPTVIDTIREGGGDYSNAFTFSKSETISGLDCDCYAYSLVMGGPHPTVTEGLMWLSDRVPFGVVKQTGISKGEDGSQLSSYEQIYVDSGAGAQGTQELIAKIGGAARPEQHPAQPSPSSPVSYAFSDAYDDGMLRLSVEVDDSSKGRLLQLSIVNKTSDLIRVLISTDEVHLRADAPIGTLKMVAVEAQELDLEPGGESPGITFRQAGERGVVDGQFSLIVYEGTPLYMGSVTIGSL